MKLILRENLQMKRKLLIPILLLIIMVLFTTTVWAEALLAISAKGAANYDQGFNGPNPVDHTGTKCHLTISANTVDGEHIWEGRASFVGQRSNMGYMISGHFNITEALEEEWFGFPNAGLHLFGNGETSWKSEMTPPYSKDMQVRIGLVDTDFDGVVDLVGFNLQEMDTDIHKRDYDVYRCDGALDERIAGKIKIVRIP
jgi:hypothetical protein